jgi:hypothetical protein
MVGDTTDVLSSVPACRTHQVDDSKILDCLFYIVFYKVSLGISMVTVISGDWQGSCGWLLCGNGNNQISQASPTLHVPVPVRGIQRTANSKPTTSQGSRIA